MASCYSAHGRFVDRTSGSQAFRSVACQLCVVLHRCVVQLVVRPRKPAASPDNCSSACSHKDHNRACQGRSLQPRELGWKLTVLDRFDQRHLQALPYSTLSLLLGQGIIQRIQVFTPQFLWGAFTFQAVVQGSRLSWASTANKHVSCVSQFQEARHCQNDGAPQNIRLMLVTLDVSQDPMGWSNATASSNMLLMSVTLEVSHESMGWLNTAVPANMRLMLVTLDVAHDLRGWLKAGVSENILFMSVSLDVSQDPMG